ncbi:hypothetical protein FH403_11530 [Salmonella enterica]|nr:hypothetical protein [Salmonella enterica]EBJ4784961.1 hypothetical protein [Salmonella enterica]ECD9475672.1 hypothetical protein [Salmonella enterica subsp. houtenae]ECI5748682.1 hypothetical protein [Salmonella enterica subsp. enterica]EDX5785301.1 hypothetical protein [Salmonella enterica]
MAETCLLAIRQPALRWHDLCSGSDTERVNLTRRCQGRNCDRTPCRKSTDAAYRDGVPRSSDEIAVMAVERRGDVIQFCLKQQLLTG